MKIVTLHIQSILVQSFKRVLWNWKNFPAGPTCPKTGSQGQKIKKKFEKNNNENKIFALAKKRQKIKPEEMR
jgi:hypothetical protein